MDAKDQGGPVSKSSHTAGQSKSSSSAGMFKPSDVAGEPKPSSSAGQSKSSDAASKLSDPADQFKTSIITGITKSSNSAGNLKTSHSAGIVKPSDSADRVKGPHAAFESGKGSINSGFQLVTRRSRKLKANLAQPKLRDAVGQFTSSVTTGSAKSKPGIAVSTSPGKSKSSDSARSAQASIVAWHSVGKPKVSSNAGKFKPGGRLGSKPRASSPSSVISPWADSNRFAALAFDVENDGADDDSVFEETLWVSKVSDPHLLA